MNILRHPAVIIVLILLVVLLFGSRRLPDLARSVGQSLKIFKKEVKELKDDGTESDKSGDKSGTGADGEPAQDANHTPAPESSAPAPTSTSGAGAPTAPSKDAASQQVPGLTDPTQPRA